MKILVFSVLCMLTCHALNAQTIFFENFENANTPFDATAYYKNQTTYCNGHIRNNTNIDCYGTAFFNRLTLDMTLKNGNGKFLFHGTYYPQTGDNTLGEVWGTTTPFAIQPNTQYAFSFYLANAFSNNIAQIQPFINGVNIGNAVSASGEGNSSWTHFTFCWQSGSASTADLSLRNLMDNAVGNDFALDDIRFEVAPVNQKTQNLSICTGESVRVGSNIYNTTGNYTDVFKSYNGCDSTIRTNLIVLPAQNKSQSISLCRGQSIQVGTNTYTQSGTFTDRLKSVNGCDSIVTTVLTVNDFKTITQNPILCNGETFKVGTKVYSTNGNFRDTFRFVNACDSIILTNLTILPAYSFTQNRVICNGEKIVVGTKTYTTTGNYRDTLKSTIGGCDSIVLTNVQVSSRSNTNQTVTICTGEKFVIGNKAYTLSGFYSDTLKSVSGCDSLVSTNLVVVRSKNFVQHINLNSNESVIVGTKTYTCNGRYVDTLKSVQGCDSVVTTFIRDVNNNRVFIPNVFSPNGDKNNDVVMIFSDAHCIRRIIRWSIFNRWGAQVFFQENFQANDVKFAWDGTFKSKDLMPDVYAYFAEIEYADGSTDFVKGDITLMR